MSLRPTATAKLPYSLNLAQPAVVQAKYYNSMRTRTLLPEAIAEV
jgi:hypothetical protein